MHKRYIVFGGSVYYPQGGFDDFLASYDVLESAEAYARGWLTGDGSAVWVHVYDSSTGRKVFEEKS